MPPPLSETNGRKSRSCLSGEMPGPESPTVTLTVPFVCIELERDPPAVGRRPERVREQVPDDLQHAVAVGDDHRPVAGLLAVVDRAAARLVAERLVRLVEQLPHVDLLGEDGEAVRVELGEIEDVADEPLEPLRLGLHRRERDVAQLRILDDALRGAPRRDRGSPSAACAARARRSSGSGARSARPRRAGSPSRRTAPTGGRARPERSPARRRRSGPPRPRRPPPRAASTGRTMPPREVDAEPAGDDEAEQRRPPRAGRAARSRGGAPRSSASRRRSRRACSARCAPGSRPRGTCGCSPGRRELEQELLARQPVDRLERQLAQPRRSGRGTDSAGRPSRCGRRSRARGSSPRTSAAAGRSTCPASSSGRTRT